MASATDEINEIRRRMATIRRELHEDVRGMVESAEAVSDWKHYIRTYPWASAGLALAIGYLVVPKRRKTIRPAEVAQAVAAQIAPVATAAAPLVAAEPERKKKGRGLIGAAFGMLAPIAMNAARNYATHFISNWIAQQQENLAAQMMAASMAQGGGPGMGMPPGAGPGQGQAPGQGQPMGGPGAMPPWGQPGRMPGAGGGR